MRTLVVLSLLAASPALAQAPAESPPPTEQKAEPAPPAPQPPSDAPKAEPAPAPAPTAPSESKVSLTNRTMPSIWLQAGAGAGAALISAPIALYVAGALGNLTNNAYVALVPWLLIVGFLPSLAVTAAVVGIGNYYSPGTFPFWRVWGLTSVANLLAVALGVVAGVSVGVFGTVLLFALCEAILLPAVAVPSARWLAKPPPEGARLASLEPWNPGAAPRWFVPAAEVSF